MAEHIDETPYPPLKMPDEEVLNDQFDNDIEQTTDEVRKENLLFVSLNTT